MIVKTTRGLVCVEVQLIVERGNYRYVVTVSRPGLEGTSVRQWVPRQGSLDDQAMRDLSAFVARTVENAIVMSWGVQGELGGL